jgi:N-acetylneuraminic acid mutarotase
MGEQRTALILLLVLCLVLSSLPLVGATEDSWTTLEPSPSDSYMDAAALDGKIYCIGGENFRYDPETNTWTEIAPLPTFNGWGAVVACQNKIYLIGGSADVPTQVYDPATDTWENRTSIPTTRSQLQANVVDGKIYVIGGQIPSPLYVINPSSSNDVYDPETDSWSQMAPIPTPVMGYASAVLDNKIYIISGGHEGSSADYEPINQVQIFDPAANQWINGTSLPTGVCYARACATTGLSAPKRIYVIGGTTNYYGHYDVSVIDLNQVYDPTTDTWTTCTSMPTPRCELEAAVVNDEIYAIGGRKEDNSLVVNEKYTPADYIPEFPSWAILPLLLMVTLAAIIYKRRLAKTQNQK